jgi:PKHD-type hydroxylase
LIICTPNVLTPDEIATMRREMDGAAFVDGSATSSYSARGVKKNLQLPIDDDNDVNLQDIVRSAFMRNVRLQAALLPANRSKALFNRYDVGMEYGLHVDSAVMGSLGDALRTDIAITIFLSDPESYDGGELTMSMSGMEYSFKLPAGAAVAYPGNTLHRVTPVTRGARYAAIVWVQSQVRDAAKRELLWDLNLAKGETFKREGKSETSDALSKCHSNLLRMWADL